MIKIFDTTLRDGEQSPGFAMTIRQKLLFAKQLEKLGVDVIEAGFPIASQDDFESVKLISQSCSSVEVCALARCNEKDINAAIRALSGAAKPRIHVFIASSDLHLQHKLKITREQAIEKAFQGVMMARSFTSQVEFTPEDASRSDRGFLVEILIAAIEAGANTLNIPDTVGYMTPDEYGDLIRYVKGHVPGIEKLVISTHCHDDLGFAVANSLAGVRNGAGQVECTINGIGERAGNASLEEVVMILKTRHDIYHAGSRIDTTQLLATSRLLSQITGQRVPPNKAIVGSNAFSHGSGIHQHGMISDRSTYEIMKPEDIGFASTQIYLSKHSGRHGLMHRLKNLGIELPPEKLDSLFEKFKTLADKKKHIYDQDLIFLAMEGEYKGRFELLSLQVASGTHQHASVQMVMRIGDQLTDIIAEGDGIVSAMYAAIAEESGLSGILTEFAIHACTPEQEAIGNTHIAWQENENIWYGHAADTDIIRASALAFIDMLNHRDITSRL